VALFSNQKNDCQHTSFHQHFTTFTPPKNHVLTTRFPKTRNKNANSPRQKKISKYKPAK